MLKLRRPILCTYVHVRTSCSKSVHMCTSGGKGEKDVNSFVARFAFYNRKVKIDHEGHNMYS